MFTWICPKCGSEVPPAYSECPNCAANAKGAPPSAAEPAAAPAQAPPAATARPAAAPRRARIPGWLLSLLFAGTFILVGLAAFLMFRAGPPAQSASQPAAVLETPAAQPSPAAQANPVLRNLELTGLRLTEDPKQKAFLQFVVVNHSAADLGEVSLKVNLKAVMSRQDQAPVGTFEFKAALGPYEAKELKVPVDTKLRVYELPDWQFLRAEVIGQ